jgi:uracil-DNA glycosylase
MSESKTEQMRQIRDEVANLTSSPLYSYRKQHNYFPVIGEGSHDSKIMFIGEAPGENGAKTGRPFCGAAGKILDTLLESAGIPRNEVYITNIVKDRPPGNRDPKPEEIALYAPFLVRQIGIIKPRVIATLGRFSMVYIMEMFGLKDKLKTISMIHGNGFQTKSEYGEVDIIPLYHPAVAVYDNRKLPELKKDFALLGMYV